MHPLTREAFVRFPKAILVLCALTLVRVLPRGRATSRLVGALRAFAFGEAERWHDYGVRLNAAAAADEQS